MILNLTQHNSTASQKEAGVIDIEDQDDLQMLRDELTFDFIPTADEINNAASTIAAIAAHYNAETAMIGGAPFLMSALEKALLAKNIKPVYAFSKRVSKEVTDPETGKVTKVNEFVHEGFVYTV